jgi:hypothetical protein
MRVDELKRKRGEKRTFLICSVCVSHFERSLSSFRGPNWLSSRKIWAMTMRERFCDEAPNVGLAPVLGEPTVLEVESEGEARTSLEAPPPLVDGAPPPGEAAAAAEDANCETALGAMVRDREDSSWPAGSCCPAGEKADEVEEAADDLRLPTRRDEAVGSDGKLVFAGEYAGRGAPGEGVLRCSCATAVDMGVKRVL